MHVSGSCRISRQPKLLGRKYNLVNIDNIIEIKRGLIKLCNEDLMEDIVSLDRCEEFYESIFTTFGLSYDTATLSQKRRFVITMTRYFILDKLPHGVIYEDGNKFAVKDDRSTPVRELLTEIIEEYFKVRNQCESCEDFMKKYAEYHQEPEIILSEEIFADKDEGLSAFARAVKRFYHYKDIN